LNLLPPDGFRILKQVPAAKPALTQFVKSDGATLGRIIGPWPSTTFHFRTFQDKHLLRLISAQAAESFHVDYKRETYGGNDDQRREFAIHGRDNPNSVFLHGLDPKQPFKPMPQLRKVRLANRRTQHS
jgi:hypothetical protein